MSDTVVGHTRGNGIQAGPRACGNDMMTVHSRMGHCFQNTVSRDTPRCCSDHHRIDHGHGMFVAVHPVGGIPMGDLRNLGVTAEDHRPRVGNRLRGSGLGAGSRSRLHCHLHFLLATRLAWIEAAAVGPGVHSTGQEDAGVDNATAAVAVAAVAFANSAGRYIHQLVHNHLDSTEGHLRIDLEVVVVVVGEDHSLAVRMMSGCGLPSDLLPAATPLSCWRALVFVPVERPGRSCADQAHRGCQSLP